MNMYVLIMYKAWNDIYVTNCIRGVFSVLDEISFT